MPNNKQSTIRVISRLFMITSYTIIVLSYVGLRSTRTPICSCSNKNNTLKISHS